MKVYLIECVGKGYDASDYVLGIVADAEYAKAWVERNNHQLADNILAQWAANARAKPEYDQLRLHKEQIEREHAKKLRRWQPNKRNKGIPPELVMPSDREIALNTAEYIYQMSELEVLDELPDDETPHAPH